MKRLCPCCCRASPVEQIASLIDHDKAVIWKARGKPSSREPEQIINEINGLYESGYDILRRFADSEPAIKTLKAFLSEAFFEVGMAANGQAWKLALQPMGIVGYIIARAPLALAAIVARRTTAAACT